MQQFFTVLGGMGTLACESYVRELDKRTPFHCDQDYLNYIVVNHATIPDRTAYILDHSNPDPTIPLVEDIIQQSILNPAFFVLTCNTAHYFYDEMQKHTDIPILHMPKLTVANIKKIAPNAKRVGLLATPGTIKIGIYDKWIKEAGYEEVKPDQEVIDKTEDLIYHDIKETGKSDGKKFHELVRTMIEDKHCDAVILGCTELSLANELNPETEFPVSDSQSVLVDKSLELGEQLRKDGHIDMDHLDEM